MKSTKTQIKDALLKVKGVKKVEIRRRVFWEVTTFIDDYKDNALRNKVYKREGEIMDELPKLDFDFHVTPVRAVRD